MDNNVLRTALKNTPGAPAITIPVSKATVDAKADLVVTWLAALIADGEVPKPVRLRDLLDIFGDATLYKTVFEHPRYAELSTAMLSGDRHTAEDILHGFEVCGIGAGGKMQAVLAELAKTDAVTRRRGEVLGVLNEGEPMPIEAIKLALLGA